MKVSGYGLALPAAMLVLACSVNAAAVDQRSRHHPAPSLGGKVGYCTDCHGASGQGYRGYYPIPRIGGQTSEYLENQLRAFVERSRGQSMPVRLSKVHALSPAMRASLAGHFSDLEPKPFTRAPRGPRNLVAVGQKIYEQGVPEANVPACAVCHGPEAAGAGPNPRLAGQLYPYTVRVLRNWTRERGLHASAQGTAGVMAPIAQSMSKDQIAAVAAYLSYLK